MKRLIIVIVLLCAFLLMGFSRNAAACAMDDTAYMAQPVTEKHQTDGKPIFVVTDMNSENLKTNWYCSDNDTACKEFLKTASQCEHYLNMLHTPEHQHKNHGDEQS